MLGAVLLQVYLILDEFILGGEIQESSKRVRHSLHCCNVLIRCAYNAASAVAMIASFVEHLVRTLPHRSFWSD